MVAADTAPLTIVDARRKSRNADFGVRPTMAYAFRLLDDDDGCGLVRVDGSDETGSNEGVTQERWIAGGGGTVETDAMVAATRAATRTPARRGDGTVPRRLALGWRCAGETADVFEGRNTDWRRKGDAAMRRPVHGVDRMERGGGGGGVARTRWGYRLCG